MGNRLINMQRQVRELGRLRTGYAGPKGPVRSKTWIVTSTQRECLDVAAELWGGQVQPWTPQNGTDRQWKLTTEADTLEGFLPPGDPLTQANEMWNRGGAQRRCNGETDSKSGQPCLCLAQYGDEWYRRSPREVCKPYSQLNVMLLQLPDLGVWRHVTKSFYAAGEIAGMVDLIKAQVGMDVMVPIRLRIDQRKKVADGTTTPYPVPVIEIRGASAGQILSGDVPSLSIAGGPSRQAIGSAPAAPAVEQPAPPAAPKLTPAQVVVEAAKVTSVASAQNLWRAAAAADALDPAAKAAIEARVAELNGKPADAPAEQVKPVSAPPVDAEMEPDPDEMFNRIISAVPDEWGTSGVGQRIAAFCGKDADEANGFELERFYRALKDGEIK